MLKKVSGAKSVFVRINNVGRNYLPFVEYLKDRVIRYIDVVPVTSLPFPLQAETAVPLLSMDSLFISVADANGNDYPIYNLPIKNLNIGLNMGRRQPVMRVTSLSDTYIDCEDASLIGKYVCLVYWYDLPEYSRNDTTMTTAIDSVEVEILSSQQQNVFPDNRTMAGKRFRGISCPNANPTVSGATGITNIEAMNIYVSFVKGNYAVLDTVPVWEFHDVSYMYETLNFSNIAFDFTNSFITIGGTNNYDGKKVMFNLTFEE